MNATPDTTSSALQTAIGFARALIGGDPVAALAYFGTEARLLTADGTEVAGREPIRAVLTQLTGSGQRLEIRPGRTIVAGSVALCQQSWRLVSSNADAPSYERASAATLVLQRSGQRWQVLIASPWSRLEGFANV